MKESRSKIKILLVQITNKNFGDSVIADNTRFLLKKSFPLWRKKAYDILDYSIGLEDVGQVKYVDAVVFAGGGLVKFRQEQLYRQVADLVTEAQRYHVPVFFNSVGVEGYDALDERCIQLKDAINQSCVKGISVRDDLQMLLENYITNKEIRIKEVYDPAIWSEKTYRGIKCDKVCKVVGLGVARETLFEDYGINKVDRDFLLRFWKELVEQLEKRNIQWMIFTNGLDADERFADEVLAYIGHGQKLPKPIDQMQLIRNIKMFQGMIACRMHSNIIAYALEIPSVGLVWNNKMTFWGEKIGYPKRFVQSEELEAQYVAQLCEESLKEGTRKPSYQMKRSVYKELRYFVRQYCKKKIKKVETFDFSKHVFASAMGGAAYKYKNMNHLGLLLDSFNQRKYQMAEIDVRMSKDLKLECVNGWNKATLRMLGIETEQPFSLTEEEFLQKKYYNFYETASFREFASTAANILKDKKTQNVIFILDVGKPSAQVIEEFYCQLVSKLKQFQIEPQNVIVRMQRKKDVKIFKKQKYPCKIAYFVSQEVAKAEESQLLKEVLQFCKDSNINLLSMGDKSFDKNVQEECAKYGIKTVVMSYTKTSDIIWALKEGADYVGSHYYSVDYLDRLTKK